MWRSAGRNHLALAAQLAHLLRGRFRRIELFLAGIEVQNALRALVVFKTQIAAQRLQSVAAVGAQAHDVPNVVARARRRAFAQKLQAPQPLAHVCAQAKEQRRIFAAQPLEQLERRAGVGPGLGVADGDLPAVGEAGFGAGRGLPVDDGDVVALLAQEISRGDAEQAGAHYDDSHKRTPRERYSQPTKR